MLRPGRDSARIRRTAARSSIVVETLTSRRSQLVRQCRTLARARQGGDGVLLEGFRLIGEAVSARVPIRILAVTDRALARTAGDGSLVRRLADQDVRIVRVTEGVMEALSPSASPAGLIAIADAPRWTWDDLLRRRPLLIVVAADVQDPGNLGAMVRVAEASGASGILACGASPDPFGWKALRGAMGSAFRIPVIVEPDPRRAIERCRASGARIFAAAPREGTSPYDVDLRQPLAVLMGGEGPGLPASVAGLADVAISIPMQPPVESLNVAVAAGVVLYEAARQRRAAPVPRATRTGGPA